jgi:type VI secretion system protein ImpG
MAKASRAAQGRILGEDLLPFYERELKALKEGAREFAALHPKIAARLSLDDSSGEDPHVERLIQGCAYLAARVQRRINDDFPLFTDSLLGMVYPQLTRPIPSLSMAHLGVNYVAQGLTEIQTIPAGTTLLFPPASGVECRFRTCYPVQLVPAELAEVSLVQVERAPPEYSWPGAAAVLILRFERAGEVDLGTLGLERLRLFIDSPDDAFDLHELFVNRRLEVLARTRAGTGAWSDRIQLGADALAPVGFGPEHSLIDGSVRALSGDPGAGQPFQSASGASEKHLEGYRLLLEYFAFPEKFLFFELANLSRALTPGTTSIEIAIPVRATARPERLAELCRAMRKDHLKLGCTPIVNLFAHQAEPIRASGRRQDHPVVPSMRRRNAYEVYAIDTVTRVRRGGNQTEATAVPPLFHFGAAGEGTNPPLNWVSHRRLPDGNDDRSSEVELTFVQRDRSKPLALEDTLAIRTLCTNRDLPSSLPFGEDLIDLQLEQPGVVQRVRCLRKPTPSIRSHLGGRSRWHLVSHLSLNYLSVVEGGEAGLRGILSLYNLRGTSEGQAQIDAILALKSGPVVRAIGDARQRAFVRGLGLELTLDENGFAGSNPYLFCAVLERFLASFCTLNTFVEVSVRLRGREGVFAQWKPKLGQALTV